MNHRRFSLVTAVMAILALSGVAPMGGAINGWTALGPEGGAVSDLRIAPSAPDVVFAMVGSEIFRSRDGGASWALVPALPFRPEDLAVDAASPEILYAVSTRVSPPDQPPFWRSLDGGESWQDLSAALPEGARVVIGSLTADPRSAGTVYLASEDGLLKSSDGGASWVTTLNRFPVALTIDPTDSRVLYGSVLEGVLKSRDGGGSWRLLEASPGRVLQIAVDPTQPSTLYGFGGLVLRSLLKSTDGGESWGEIAPQVLGSLKAFVVTASGSLYSEGRLLLRSDDGGLSWRQTGPVGEGFWRLAPHPEDPEVVFGFGRFGLIRGLPGDAWEETESGIERSSVAGLEIDAQTPSSLYAVSPEEGIFRSDDGGVTWIHRDTGLPEEASYLAQSRQDRNRLYAVAGHNVYRSDDGGGSWIGPLIEPPPAPGSLSVAGLAVDPTNDRRVMAVGLSRRSGPGFFLRRSSDGGTTWLVDLSRVPFPADVSIDPQQPDVVLVSGRGIARSSNGGLNWSIVVDEHSGYFGELAIAPSDPRVVYAGSADRGGPTLLKSSDRGWTWKSPGSDLDGLGTVHLAVAPDDPQTVYAATEAGLFLSEDGGAIWARLGDLTDPVLGVAVNPLFPRSVYVGTSGFGVQKLTRAAAGGCGPGEALCLQGERFHAEVAWRDFEGRRGLGVKTPLTDNTGHFWFFDRDNLELAVKVHDGGEWNDHFWVFFASLSNVAYTLQVTDSETERVRSFANPVGRFASRGDVEAFPAAVGEPVAVPHSAPRPGRASGPGGEPLCARGGQTLCLGDRFELSVSWRDFADRSGVGSAERLTADTGYFWFFDPRNAEVVVKVVDGTGTNGHHWVFYGSLTNVEFALEVTDLQTGASRRYENPLGVFASAGDIQALPEPARPSQTGPTRAGLP